MQPGRSISRTREVLYTLYIILGSVGLIVGIFATVVKTLPELQVPEVAYFTKDLMTYPIGVQDDKLVPREIQGKVMVEGPFKIINVVVQNEGERVAWGLVMRSHLSSNDGYLIGWMSKSENPSTVRMLDEAPEYALPKLLPGDSVSFFFSLKNANSNLANRAEVFDAEGRRATYYPYVPVRYDGVVIRRCWVYLLGLIFCLMLVVILLLSVSRTTKPGRPAVSGEREMPADTSEHPLVSSPGSLTQGQMSGNPPPRHWTAGGR